MQGKTVNGYTLQSLLGAGGMAEVWLAENSIGNKAAVKVLFSNFCNDSNVITRFSTEAKVMVELNHPNIRHVYDYGNIDGRPCIVMEYLDGDDLKSRMKRGQKFTEKELEHWWNQLVDALNYTHNKGIVHRDIKPGNIFVDREGNIKLLDFGIAKVRESISSTQTGQKLGTLMYMSPEQVKDSKHIDYHTDLYSLAVTFVHLITGKKPYNSDTSSDFEISEQIVYNPLDLSGLPATWRSFLEPYLSKEPKDRPVLRPFGSHASTTKPATKLLEDEATVCSGDTTPKAVTTKTLNPQKKQSRKGLWFILIFLILAAGGVVIYLGSNDKNNAAEGKAAKEKENDTRGEDGNSEKEAYSYTNKQPRFSTEDWRGMWRDGYFTLEIESIFNDKLEGNYVYMDEHWCDVGPSFEGNPITGHMGDKDYSYVVVYYTSSFMDGGRGEVKLTMLEKGKIKLKRLWSDGSGLMPDEAILSKD